MVMSGPRLSSCALFENISDSLATFSDFVLRTAV
jgi:hypothetical protein